MKTNLSRKQIFIAFWQEGEVENNFFAFHYLEQSILLLSFVVQSLTCGYKRYFGCHGFHINKLYYYDLCMPYTINMKY